MRLILIVSVLVLASSALAQTAPMHAPERTALESELDTNTNFKLMVDAARHGDRSAVDTLLDQWCTGRERLQDGRWPLALFASQIELLLDAWKDGKDDAARVQQLRQAHPDSRAAVMLDALRWHESAWAARGGGYAADVSKEGWILFRQRLAEERKVLEAGRAVASSCPLWHELMIELMIDQGENPAAIRSVFDEGVRAFPEYHSLYFAMARAYEPKWGGSAEQFDAFAQEAAHRTSKFEGMGMYARLYWTVDNANGLPFQPAASRYPQWPLLRRGWADLEHKYPTSMWNLNEQTAVACRSDDSTLYRRLRHKLGVNLYADMFQFMSVDACDLRNAGANQRNTGAKPTFKA